MIGVIPPAGPAPRPQTLCQDRYVVFNNVQIQTLVTSSPSRADSWISTTEDIYSLRPPLIVGLDVKWRPNFCRSGVQNPVATLQLCMGRRCLIFQLIHAPFIPISVFRFLGNASNIFVGVSIEEDAKKLLEQYDLNVAAVVDLRILAAEKLQTRKLRTMKALAMEVLRKEMEKLKWIATGRWDSLQLTPEQIRYACIDAFISFEIGMFLYYRVYLVEAAGCGLFWWISKSKTGFNGLISNCFELFHICFLVGINLNMVFWNLSSGLF